MEDVPVLCKLHHFAEATCTPMNFFFWYLCGGLDWNQSPVDTEGTVRNSS